jgi:hypothetical protein
MGFGRGVLRSETKSGEGYGHVLALDGLLRDAGTQEVLDSLYSYLANADEHKPRNSDARW